jgi:iron complex transport system permease protein
MKGFQAKLKILPFLFFALCIFSLLALLKGTEPLDLSKIFEKGSVHSRIFFHLRLPRVLLAILVGGTLSLAGATLQALFRNPLASPFTLGVSGGGAFGASLVIGLGISGVLGGIPLLFLSAFFFALITVFGVYHLSRIKGMVLTGTLLLAGVVANFFYSACILLIQYLSDYARTYQTVTWMMGSLDIIGIDMILWAFPPLFVGWVFLLSEAKGLNVVTQGEEVALSLGVEVPRLIRRVYFITSMLVGISVAIAGPIGFVGLIVPHMVRLLVGQDMRVVLPISLFSGSIFLIIADLIARIILSPIQLPVGLITSFMGVPFFLFLLRQKRKEMVF